MPDESQNLVAVMSAMTVLTPGAKAAPSCWPTRSALATSISVGSVTTTAGKCCGSVTGAIPWVGRQLRRDPGFPAGRGSPGWSQGLPLRGTANQPSLSPRCQTFNRATPLQPAPPGHDQLPPGGTPKRLFWPLRRDVFAGAEGNRD